MFCGKETHISMLRSFNLLEICTSISISISISIIIIIIIIIIKNLPFILSEENCLVHSKNEEFCESNSKKQSLLENIIIFQ